MILDCHVHLNNYHEDVVVSLEQSLDRLEDTMARAGVDHALVLTSFIVSPHRPSTAEVVRAVEQRPRLSVVAGISYLSYRQRDLRELADFLSDRRVVGLKIYPGYEPFYPHDRRLRVVYDLAEEFDVPVMIHSGDTFTPTGKVKYSHPLEVDEVAVDHRAVKFVICHLGNPWLVDCMEVVYKNPNVWADFSGLALGEFTESFEEYMSEEVEDAILYAADPKRFLFGSDWPLGSMRSHVNFVRRLRMPEEARRLILYENARNLFRLPLPADEAPPEGSGA